MRPDLCTLAIGLCGDRRSWSVGVGAVPGGIVVESGGRGGGMVALRPALSFARLQGLHLLSGWDGSGALTYGDFNLLGGSRPIRSEHPHKLGSRSVVDAQGWAALPAVVLCLRCSLKWLHTRLKLERPGKVRTWIHLLPRRLGPTSSY